MNNNSDKINRLKKEIENTDVIVIGAGAGLSTSAGFIYSGERFQKYFFDFAEKYGFKDMYSGGFYPFESFNEHWAYWSRYIYINRYMNPPKPVYSDLFEVVRDKDYFVLTTNVDHCFQKAGFAKERLFYTQGDFGLFQCSKPCHDEIYDNEETIREMILAQGFQIDENGGLIIPSGVTLKMQVPSDLLPVCPVCGRPFSMNLRADDTFVECDGWHTAAGRYRRFLEEHEGQKILFLELGVGFNTPGIVKYPFWQMTAENKNATYCCINYGDAACPDEILDRAICINSDIGDIIEKLNIS